MSEADRFHTGDPKEGPSIEKIDLRRLGIRQTIPGGIQRVKTPDEDETLVIEQPRQERTMG